MRNDVEWYIQIWFKYHQPFLRYWGVLIFMVALLPTCLSMYAEILDYRQITFAIFAKNIVDLVFAILKLLQI